MTNTPTMHLDDGDGYRVAAYDVTDNRTVEIIVRAADGGAPGGGVLGDLGNDKIVIAPVRVTIMYMRDLSAAEPWTWHYAKVEGLTVRPDGTRGARHQGKVFAPQFADGALNMAQPPPWLTRMIEEFHPAANPDAVHPPR